MSAILITLMVQDLPDNISLEILKSEIEKCINQVDCVKVQSIIDVFEGVKFDDDYKLFEEMMPANNGSIYNPLLN